MISLTDVAAAEVRSAMDAVDNPEVALRVAVQPGGCAGLQYNLSLDVGFWDDDTIVDVDGVRVVIDPASAPFLRQATVDIQEGPNGPAFAIVNPQMSGVCSCAQHCDAQYFEEEPPAPTLDGPGRSRVKLEGDEPPARRRGAGRVPVRSR